MYAPHNNANRLKVISKLSKITHAFRDADRDNVHLKYITNQTTKKNLLRKNLEPQKMLIFTLL